MGERFQAQGTTRATVRGKMFWGAAHLLPSLPLSWRVVSVSVVPKWNLAVLPLALEALSHLARA